MVRTRQAEAMVLALAIACWLAPSLRAQTGTTYPGIFDHWENGRRSADTLSAPPIMASGSFHWTQPNFDGDVQVAFPEIPVPTTSNPDSMPPQFTLASKMTVKATLLGKYTITAGAGPSTISISGLMGAGSPSSCTPAPQNITGVAGGAVVSVSYTITCDITALNTTAANDPRGRGLGFFSLQFNLVSGDGKNSVSDFVSADIFYRYLLPTITAISHEVANGGSDNGQNSGDPSQTSLEEIISGTNFPPFGYIILKRSDQNSSAPDSGPSDTSNPPQSDVVVVPATFKNASEIDAKLQGFKAVPEGYYDVILNNGYHRNIATGRRLLYVSSLRVNLEVNQGVPMPCSSSKPCVAQHDMVIRAKVSCDGLTQAGDPCEKGKDRATGRLFLTKPDGTVQTLPAPVPVTVHSVATPASNQDRKQGLDAFNFFFTHADRNQLDAGTYKLQFEIDPRNPSTQPSAIQPDDKKNLVVTLPTNVFMISNVAADHAIGTGGFRIREAKGAMSIAAMVDPQDAALNPTDTILGYFEMLYAAYPASRSAISVRVEPAPIAFTQTPPITNPNLDPKIDERNDAAQDADYARVQAALRAWLDQNAARGSPPYTHVVYFTSRAWFPGLSECKAATNGLTGVFLFWFCSARDSIVLLRGVNTNGSVPHELGHNYKLGDTYPPPNTLSPRVNPIKDPLCGFFGDGCPVEDGNFDTVQRTVSVAAGQQDPDVRNLYKRDFMGNVNREFRWVDVRSWDILYPFFNVPPAGSSNSKPVKPVRSAAAATPADIVTIRGTINQDGTGSFLPFIRGYGVPADPGPADPSVPAGSYTIEMQDSSGRVLDSRSFDPTFTAADFPIPRASDYFSEQLALPPGTARFVLKNNGTPIDTRTISANSPSVQMVQPMSGATLQGTTTIRWSGTDPDGIPMTYAVFYSVDGGQSWVPLAAELSASSFEWDTTQSAGSGNAALMVVASDGFNEASATSTSLTVPLKTPSVHISMPPDGAVIAAGAPLRLAAAGYDLQDRELQAAAFSWNSNLDGPLGQGEAVTPRSLSPGLHTITVTAANSTGQTTTASIHVTVQNVGPQIRLSAQAADFGSVTVGATKDAQLTITNAGAAPLVVSALTVAGTGFSLVTPQPPVSLAPGGSVTLIIRFTPSSSGATSGTLTITSNDPQTSSVAVVLTGSGLAPAGPQVSVSPASLDFGAVAIGQSSAAKSLTVSNGGIGTVTLTLSSTGPFTAALQSPTLAGNSTGTISVTFSPATVGPQTGTVSVSVGTQNVATVNLTGAGVAPASPQISITPNTLAFGSVTVGQSTTMTCTLKNSGSATLNVSSLSTSAPFAVVSPSAPFSLTTGNTTTVTVRFSPASAGAQSGKLTIASNDPANGNATVTLSGTGLSLTSSDIVLKVDGGTFSGALGFLQGDAAAVFVNRLTPPSYPATLKSVQIYFGSRPTGLALNAPITVLAATSPSGSTAISPLAPGVTINSVPGSVTTLGAFNSYSVPPTTITAGDFVVGFLVNNPINIAPADLDKATPSQKRSYASGDGLTFTLIDNFGADTAGNFGIRATVTLGP